MISWLKKLNKKERKHLFDMSIRTKYDFKKQVEFLREQFKKPQEERIVCWDCISICRKLGINLKKERL